MRNEPTDQTDAAVASFLATALKNDFESITIQGSASPSFRDECKAAGVVLFQIPGERSDLSPGCGVWLVDGSDVPCKALATDQLGNFTVLTTDDKTRQYLSTEMS